MAKGKTLTGLILTSIRGGIPEFIKIQIVQRFSLYFFITCFIFFHNCQAQKSWDQVVENFQKQHKELQIGPLHIAYLDNLRSIHSPDSQDQQLDLFLQIQQSLRAFSRDQLEPQQQLEYDLLCYQIKLNLERLKLEKDWEPYRSFNISEAGLATVPMGKEWYTYFLHAWLDNSVQPDSLFAFGLRESNRVYAAMQAIRDKSGLDSLAFAAQLSSTQFLIDSPKAVEDAIQTYAEFVEPQLGPYFPDYIQNPSVQVARGTNKRLAQVPAYYSNGTFFYNLFDYPFNLRQVAFLYLHEANPGHHYELSHRRLAKQFSLQSSFYAPGYGEGWAAYIEDLAVELDWYRDIYDEYGKWEWDMIRSVRIVLDVGLNYYSWTDEESLKFWNQYLPGQENIAQREIARMKRWPAQVISYKYGSQLILNWKKRWLAEDRGTLLAFHEAVLRHGPLPFSILEHLIFTPKHHE